TNSLHLLSDLYVPILAVHHPSIKTHFQTAFRLNNDDPPSSIAPFEPNKYPIDQTILRRNHPQNLPWQNGYFFHKIDMAARQYGVNADLERMTRTAQHAHALLHDNCFLIRSH